MVITIIGESRIEFGGLSGYVVVGSKDAPRAPKAYLCPVLCQNQQVCVKIWRSKVGVVAVLLLRMLTVRRVLGSLFASLPVLLNEEQ